MRYVGLLVVVLACSKRDAAIAELKQADGPVEKQQGGDAWQPAPLGTKYQLGDAARTADGGAQLAVVGGARLAMQSYTVLRFGGKAGQSKLSVELGAIDLSGTGSYGLDVGEVRLGNGNVHIAAGAGKTTITLTLGQAQVSTLDGKTIDLTVDTSIDITLTDVVVVPLPDARPPDAAIADAAAPADAASAIADGTIEVTGTHAELQRAGEASWAPLPAGKSDLTAGANVRLGAGTTAKLVARGTSLDLAGGARVAIAADGGLTLEAGGALVATTGDGKVTLRGGALALTGSDQAPAQSRLEPAGRGTTVTVQRGAARLTGAGGSELALTRGESATLLDTGVIRTLEAIPTYFDLRVAATDGSFTIHDPRPPVAVQFQLAGACPGGGIVELDNDAKFRTAKVSGGKEAANVLVRAGGWHYRVRCTAGAGEGGAVASGRIAVVADGGTRSLPPKPGVNPFVIDGRPWSFSYQSAIPDLAVQFPGTGTSFRLHLARGGKDLTFESTTPKVRVPGSALAEGTYTYWFDRDGVKQDKLNTLKIDFDQTAPQVYIESPVNGKPWSGDLDVRGAVLPGWTAAVDGVGIPVDGKTRRFAAKVGAPPGNALAIRLSHPQRGVHYYLRRQK